MTHCKWKVWCKAFLALSLFRSICSQQEEGKYILSKQWHPMSQLFCLRQLEPFQSSPPSLGVAILCIGQPFHSALFASTHFVCDEKKAKGLWQLIILSHQSRDFSHLRRDLRKDVARPWSLPREHSHLPDWIMTVTSFCCRASFLHCCWCLYMNHIMLPRYYSFSKQRTNLP